MRCTVPAMVIMGFRVEGGVCLGTNFLVGPVNNGGDRLFRGACYDRTRVMVLD